MAKVLSKRVAGILDDRGRAIVDPVPMSLPVGYTRPTPLHETIAKLVSRELSRRAADIGFETEEEADDFDVDDDPELKTPYELDAEVRSAVTHREVRNEIESESAKRKAASAARVAADKAEEAKKKASKAGDTAD